MTKIAGFERAWWEEDDGALDTCETPGGALHIGPREGAHMRPEDDLEDIELGERVSEWLLDAELAALNTREEDRVFSATRQLVIAVAQATSWRGLPFPEEWWPPLSGPMPESMKGIRSSDPDAE